MFFYFVLVRLIICRLKNLFINLSRKEFSWFIYELLGGLNKEIWGWIKEKFLKF